MWWQRCINPTTIGRMSHVLAHEFSKLPKATHFSIWLLDLNFSNFSNFGNFSHLNNVHTLILHKEKNSGIPKKALGTHSIHSGSLSSLEEVSEMEKWEDIIEKVSSNRRPNQTDMEIAFKKLGFCKRIPKYDIMYYNMNWMSGICKKKELVERWDAQQIVTIFYACARLGFIESEMMGLMARSMVKNKHLQRMNEVNLSLLLYSLGLLGVHGKDAGKLNPCGIFFGVSELSGELIKEVTKPNRLGMFSEGQLAHLWYGIAMLKFYNEEILLPLANECIAAKRLGYYKEDALVQIVFCAAVVRYKNKIFRREILDEAKKPDRLNAYTEGQIADLMHGLGLWEMRDELVLTLLASEIIRGDRITEFTEQGLATIITSWGVLKWFDHDALSVVADEISKPKRIMAMTDLGLNYVGKVFGMLKGNREIKQLREATLYCIKHRRTGWYYDV